MENYQIIAVILTVVGVLITLALGVNAFFLKGIFSDLNEVKVQLAEISTRGEAKESRIKKLEENETTIFERLNKLERDILK